jgi:LysR family pca operon transcriptional activator
VTLTSHGETFRRYAHASVSALNQGVAAISQAREQGGYSLAIGALPTVAARIMPAAIQRAKADGLAAGIRVVTGPNEVLLTQLRNGDLDLVVGRLAEPAQMQGLAFEHLYSEEIVFVVRPGHALTAADPVPLGALAEHTVLMPTAASVIRPFVDRMLLAQGIAALPDTIESVSADFGRRYTLGSDAVWVISHGVVAGDLVEGRLVRLRIDAEPARGPVGLTLRTDIAEGVSLQRLLQAIRAVAAEAA